MLNAVSRHLQQILPCHGQGLRTSWGHRARLCPRHNSTLTPNRREVQPTDTSRFPLFDNSRTLRYTQSPNPSWKLGQRPEPLVGSDVERKRWDMEKTSPGDIYRLMTSAIVPRPIAFVSTLSVEGIPNLAPFSYFSMVSHNPPMLSISFSLSKRRPKDTRENILSMRQFTVNIVSEPFVEAANATSVESPASTDEWVLSGLTQEPSLFVKPALVKESPVGIECELYSFQDICAPKSSEITTTVVLGLVKHIHVLQSVMDESGACVDPAKLRPVSRLGGTHYARVTEAFELPRIDWNNHLGETYNGLLG